MGRRKKNAPPAPTAWCELHDRLMNDRYVRNRRCTIKRCKYLYWLVDGIKIPHRPDKEESKHEKA